MPRIRERDVVKPQAAQGIHQFLEADQAIHGHRGLNWEAIRPGPRYALGDTTLQPLQAAIEFVLGKIGAVDRDDQSVEPSCRQLIDITRQEPPVGNDRTGYPGSCGL